MDKDFYFGNIDVSKIILDPSSFAGRGFTFGVSGKGQSFAVEGQEFAIINEPAEKKGESNG